MRPGRACGALPDCWVPGKIPLPMRGLGYAGRDNEFSHAPTLCNGKICYFRILLGARLTAGSCAQEGLQRWSVASRDRVAIEILRLRLRFAFSANLNPCSG